MASGISWIPTVRHVLQTEEEREREREGKTKNRTEEGAGRGKGTKDEVSALNTSDVEAHD